MWVVSGSCEGAYVSILMESTWVTSGVLADSSRNGGTGIHAKGLLEMYVKAGDKVNDVAWSNGV